VIPILGFGLKVGNGSAFNTAYIAAFGNQTIFPNATRATAIGIVNFIARSVTVFSFFVAETPKPIPIMAMCFITLLAFLVSLSLPTIKEEQEKLGLIKEFDNSSHSISNSHSSRRKEE